MNKTRRQWVQTIINTLKEQRDEISRVSEEEQEAFDNIPESLQYSERGEAMENTIDELNDAESDLDDLIQRLYDIIS